jgi:hypothetical protein
MLPSAGKLYRWRHQLPPNLSYLLDTHNDLQSYFLQNPNPLKPSGYWMEASGQFHAPAALLPGKGSPVPIRKKAGQALEPAWTEKSLTPVRN